MRGIRTNMGDPNTFWKVNRMVRESEMPIVVRIDRTTQPVRSEGALLW